MLAAEQCMRDIYNAISFRKITMDTYKLVQENAHIIEPNSIYYGMRRQTIMNLLCDYADENDVEFAKFWLSTKFAKPIDLMIVSGTGRTCVDELIQTYSIHDSVMLKVMLDSKPGQTLLLREASNLEMSPLMDELCNTGLASERLTDIVLCHVNIEAITNEHKQILGFDDKNLAELKKHARKVHGYDSNDATRVFCLTLLISEKILNVCY